MFWFYFAVFWVLEQNGSCIVYFHVIISCFLSARGDLKIYCEALPSELTVECKCDHWPEAGNLISGQRVSPGRLHGSSAILNWTLNMGKTWMGWG